MISYCITCMGRRQHLEQTLRASMQAALEDEVPSEFVLLDYSSPDGLQEFIAREMLSELRDGRLVYYRLEGATHFSLSHAKNVAHRLARGTIVCNLDADNIIVPAFTRYLHEALAGGRQIAAFPRCDASFGGSSGRIALQKGDFEELGGYSEQLQGWGWEDVDLIERAALAGISQLEIPLGYARALRHSHRLRVEHQPVKRRFHSCRQNKDVARAAIRANGARANAAGFGRAIVFKNLERSAIELR